jgi:hypothetical protein
MFTIASAVSLVLLIGTAVLWVRSFDRYYYAGFTLTRICGFEFHVDRGLFVIACFHGLDVPTTQAGWLPEPGHLMLKSNSSVGMQYAYNALASERQGPLGWLHIWHRSQRNFWDWSAPAWLILVLTAILPSVYAVVSWRRHRRGASGCCRCCGYDLRATPDQCPECGAAVVRSAPAGPPGT